MLGRERSAASSFCSRVWACRIIQTGSVLVISECLSVEVRGCRQGRAGTTSAAPDDSGARTGRGSRAVWTAGLRGLAAGSAQRVEFAQGFGLLAGGNLFGQQPAGHRAVRQSPHTVPAGHVDAA